MRAVAFLLVLAACTAHPEGSPPKREPDAAASSPGLDPTFGTDGFFVWSSAREPSQHGRSVALQQDGKLVVSGSHYSNDFVDVARLLPSGAVDLSFGGAGTGHVLLPELAFAYSVEIALAPDGKIYVLAIGYRGADTKIARLDPTGALDATWGIAGIVRVSAGPAWLEASAIAVQIDGKLIVANVASLSARVTRFRIDGEPDPSFGDGGIATIPAGMKLSGGVAVDGEGRIVVGAEIQTNLGSGAALVRLLANGSMDATFGLDGVALIPPSYANVSSVAFEPDGKIVAAGATSLGHGYIARFEANGTLDASVDGGIVATVARPPRRVAVDPTRKIVVWSRDGISRFDANGGADTTLNGTGRVVASPRSIASGLLQTDGSLVSIGDSVEGADAHTRIAVTRRTSLGALDPMFGDAGVSSVGIESASDLALSIEPTRDGKVLVLAASGIAYRHLLRVTADGKLDSPFGTDGISVTPHSSDTFAVDPAGRAVTLQQVYPGFVLQRIETNGKVDSTFGTAGGAGISYSYGTIGSVHAFGAHSDGRVVVAGPRGGSRVPSEGDDLYVFRATPHGAPDTSFGGDGFADMPTGSTAFVLGRMAALDDGGVLVPLTFDPMNENRRAAIARFAVDGSPAAFGASGIAYATELATAALAVIAQPQGGIVMLARAGSGADAFLLERLDDDGRPDRTFGAGGAVFHEGTAPARAARDAGPDLAVDSAGRLYVASVAVEDGHHRMAVFRYTADGVPDATWGPDGRRVLRSSPGVDVASSIRVAADGKLLVAGRVFTQTGGSDLVVARLVP